LDNDHSIYPVCEGGLDNIKGVVHVKSLLHQCLQNEAFDLRTYVSSLLTNSVHLIAL
jgi:putative hemolysin